MTDPLPSTMATSEVAAPSRDNTQANTTPKNPKEHLAAKSLVMHASAFMIHAYFPTQTKPTKFNPITAMKKLFCIMLKDEPSLVLCTSTNDKQAILESTPLLTGKNEFQIFLLYQ